MSDFLTSSFGGLRLPASSSANNRGNVDDDEVDGDGDGNGMGGAQGGDVLVAPSEKE